MKRSFDRRSDVRAVVDNWNAEITQKDANKVITTISNIGVNGAYILTQHSFKHNVDINVLVSSPLVSFCLNALIVRTDAYGIGVSFVDLGRLSKEFILSETERKTKEPWEP